MSSETARPPEVAAALARLADHDSRAAEDAESAWAWVAPNERVEEVQLSTLQDFLWYFLPRKWGDDPDEHLAIAAALARLFDELGAPEYAAVCRSSSTREIINAWQQDPDAAFTRYTRAVERSGVAVPDTPELSWGGIMPIEEARARDHVARRLEQAVRAGRIKPGAKGWRSAQVAVTSQALSELVPDYPGGQTWLQTVLTARLQQWVERFPNPVRRWYLDALEAQLLHPVAVPGDADHVVAPLQWLLRQAGGEGLALTERHNLARAVVLEARERFGWGEDRLGVVSREDDLPELAAWDELVRQQRWVRRRGRRLLATKAGSALVDDVEAAWRGFAGALVDASGWSQFVRWTSLLVLLAHDGEVAKATVEQEVSGVAEACGWREQDSGEPPPPRAVRHEISPFLYDLRLYELLSASREAGEPRVRLTPAGQATALEALRQVGAGPGGRR